MGDTRLPTENDSWLPASTSKPVVSIPSAAGEAPGGWLAEYRIGLQSLPYLAGHSFHDMVVLPGSFHIELVRQLHWELFQREAVSLRHIAFERPVILSEELALTVRVEQRAGDLVAYALFEATADDLRDSPEQPPCARMEVDLHSTGDGSRSSNLQFPEFLQNASPAGPSDRVYRDLRRNGNQYGPAFQVLASVSEFGVPPLGGSEIQPASSEIVGQLVPASASAHSSPPLLDAAPQLLSAFATARGRTFILKSIDRLTAPTVNESKPAWVHASRQAQAGDPAEDLIGNVQILAASGEPLWEFTGVTLAFIDRPAGSAAGATPLVVASTFTAEPLEDSLRFWGGHFGRGVQVEFAPYNQVFQQLLDPAGAFHRNRDGLNVVVLGLEDWWQGGGHTLPSADAARAAACFGARARTILPNGLEIAHLNRYETDYVYQEIFGDESYLRHDIRLADGDTVIDIGANIGLFSLFVMSRCKDPAIYAFEPSPRVFDLLQANCAAYGDPARVHAFNRGVSEKKGHAQFTFYEHSSVFSSFHPDEREDRAAVEAVVRNVMEQELAGESDVLEADVEQLTSHRLRAETIDCPLTSVSDIIRENGLRKIHLLKIDAEKSEMEILRGIEEEHWPLIEQIVMEIHDRTRAAVQSIEDQLTRRGFRCAVVEEKLLEDSGLFNIYATRHDAPAVANTAEDGLKHKVDEFCRALDSFAARTSTPLILAIAPRAAGTSLALDAAEEQVLARAARHARIRTVSSESILGRYPVRQLHDAHSHQLGHMPFTPEGYAAIGTALSRAIFAVDAPPVKVIVLDCDNTLWQGLCAEDGPAGVTVTPPFRHLQDFMIRQTQAGTLLALCSKNQEADVLAVFEQHPGMQLRREHIAALRINWESKPDNLRALAAQLNLGLDSFVFIDDNPVECAAVRAACPEVTVLQLPGDATHIPAFLDHVWVLDRAAATAEDRERSQWYQANSQREELQAAAPTLHDFLADLQLHIAVTEATGDQLARVAQLTVRTNQFNFTSLRRSEAEIRDLLKSGAKCLVTTVSDRFGDYGLVGAILYTTAEDRYTIDTFLLSCRALGKGVEHRMLSELAGRAVRDGKSTIALEYRPTDRNEPARAFLAKLGATPAEGPFTLELPAAALAALRYAPDERTTTAAAPIVKSGRPVGINRARLGEAMQTLGERLYSVDAVVADMEAAQQEAQAIGNRIAPEALAGGTTLEQSLAAIWKKALGRAQIGLNENFFDAGGTSLKAVVVVAMIRKQLHKDVSIVSLFESPTIALLAARLDGSAAPSESAASAESRGRQRRHKLVKRRVA